MGAAIGRPLLRLAMEQRWGHVTAVSTFASRTPKAPARGRDFHARRGGTPTRRRLRRRGLKLGSKKLLPDAPLVYRLGRALLDAFVEVDLGTEGTRFFAGKVDRYISARYDGGWRTHLPRWPMTLTITPTAARAASLWEATSAQFCAIDFWATPECSARAGASPAQRSRLFSRRQSNLRRQVVLSETWASPHQSSVRRCR